ncbi:MAG: inner-rane translocator, partial [Mycobacterium sp.]|nr:inner-rane translocator [Mycobacterium sp.]
MIGVDLALAGIAVGAVAALAGLGVLVTYRTTGVFNLASGGMAMLVAYVLWQLVRVWHWPLWVAAPIAVLIV